jgi:GNAT superfamily N-acetyltransferase
MRRSDAADAERIVAVHGTRLRMARCSAACSSSPPHPTRTAGLAAPPPCRSCACSPSRPPARGLGVGEALVRECARRARAAGAAALGLHTSASMRAAQRLYARLGFVRDPATDFQPDGAEVVEGFRLALGPEG